MNVLRIAAADLKRVAKDRMALLWLLVMPLVMAYVFGSAMRGGGPPATWIPVIDLDRQELSALFVEQLREEGYYIELKDAPAQAELKAKWPYGVVIPAGFGDAVLQGKQVKVTLVKGNGAPEEILEVQSRLLHAIVRLTEGLALADVSHRAWDPASRAALKEALARPQLLTVVRAGHRTLRPPPSGFSQSLPGMLVMFVIQMILTYGGTSLVKDRLGGQMRRLLAAPVQPLEAYAGKVLARVAMGCAQAVVLLGCGSIAFGLSLGDHPLFLVPVVLALAPGNRRWTVRTAGVDASAGLPGSIDEIGYLIDPNQHTAVIKGYVENPGEQLRAGQFISATVPIPPPAGVVEIPLTALMDDGQQSIVFVQPDAAKAEYTMRRVQVTNRFDNRAFVRSTPVPKEEQLSAREAEEGCLPKEPLQPGDRVINTAVGELKAALYILESQR